MSIFSYIPNYSHILPFLFIYQAACSFTFSKAKTKTKTSIVQKLTCFVLVNYSWLCSLTCIVVECGWYTQCYWMEMIFHLPAAINGNGSMVRSGTLCLFPILHGGLLYDFNLYRPFICYYPLFQFIQVSALLWLEDTVASESTTMSSFSNIPAYLHSVISFEGKGLIESTYLGLYSKISPLLHIAQLCIFVFVTIYNKKKLLWRELGNVPLYRYISMSLRFIFCYVPLTE